MLNDKANDAYGLSHFLAMFLSPIIGSILYKNYGHKVTCDTVALIDIIWATILLIFNCGFNVFEENIEF